jgi:hypothetical protein
MSTNNSGFLKIYPPQCEKQQQHAQEILTLIDDMGAAAVGLATGGQQGYIQFIEARERFRTSFLEMTKHYRYVE